MPLDQGQLRDSLKPLFQPGSMPTADAVGAWARAYIPYASQAIAGALKLVTPLSPVPGAGADFFEAIDQSFRAMWMATGWAGPAVVGAVTIVPPLGPYLKAYSAILLTSFDRELALSSIAVALHTYTLSIIVTATPATGTPFPVPLT